MALTDIELRRVVSDSDTKVVLQYRKQVDGTWQPWQPVPGVNVETDRQEASSPPPAVNVETDRQAASPPPPVEQTPEAG